MPNSHNRAPRLLREKRVVLVEDETLFLHLAARYLTEYLGMHVVGQARDGVEGLAMCREKKPDVVLIDLRLPQLSGDDLIRCILQELPAIKIIVVSGVYEPVILAELIKVGIHGYISKQDSHDSFSRALTAVFNNQSYFSVQGEELTAENIPLLNHPRLRDLTNRERQVLVHVCAGRTNKEIATLLGIETKTVESHRSRLCRKVGVDSTVALVVVAAKAGVIKV